MFYTAEFSSGESAWHLTRMFYYVQARSTECAINGIGAIRSGDTRRGGAAGGVFQFHYTSLNPAPALD
ncbi:hypothetical protein EVAR_4254_1 [Eumeta japonica]|uniref:Uncharacterized protein n=1 Tax=Eumeta variegata TaxID=151549 RepID=A0A4C1Z7V1_EUMVA|nr:hypothetical protein EVAR_4254_1 [Eumeta japonica]